MRVQLISLTGIIGCAVLPGLSFPIGPYPPMPPPMDVKDSGSGKTYGPGPVAVFSGVSALGGVGLGVGGMLLGKKVLGKKPTPKPNPSGRSDGKSPTGFDDSGSGSDDSRPGSDDSGEGSDDSGEGERHVTFDLQHDDPAELVGNHSPTLHTGGEPKPNDIGLGGPNRESPPGSHDSVVGEIKKPPPFWLDDEDDDLFSGGHDSHTLNGDQNALPQRPVTSNRVDGASHDGLPGETSFLRQELPPAERNLENAIFFQFNGHLPKVPAQQPPQYNVASMTNLNDGAGSMANLNPAPKAVEEQVRNANAGAPGIPPTQAQAHVVQESLNEGASGASDAVLTEAKASVQAKTTLPSAEVRAKFEKVLDELKRVRGPDNVEV